MSGACSCRPSRGRSRQSRRLRFCLFPPTCGEGVALEHNGDLYSCDHFVYPPYRLGNILRDAGGDLVRSEPQRGLRGREARHPARVLPRLPVPLRLQRRVPQAPHPADARRRARPQLALRRAQGVLHAHGAPTCATAEILKRAARLSEVMPIPRRSPHTVATTVSAAAARSSSVAAALWSAAPTIEQPRGPRGLRGTRSPANDRGSNHAQRQAQHPRRDDIKFWNSTGNWHDGATRPTGLHQGINVSRWIPRRLRTCCATGQVGLAPNSTSAAPKDHHRRVPQALFGHATSQVARAKKYPRRPRRAPAPTTASISSSATSYLNANPEGRLPRAAWFKLALLRADRQRLGEAGRQCRNTFQPARERKRRRGNSVLRGSWACKHTLERPWN